MSLFAKILGVKGILSWASHIGKDEDNADQNKSTCLISFINNHWVIG